MRGFRAGRVGGGEGDQQRAKVSPRPTTSPTPSRPSQGRDDNARTALAPLACGRGLHQRTQRRDAPRVDVRVLLRVLPRPHQEALVARGVRRGGALPRRAVGGRGPGTGVNEGLVCGVGWERRVRCGWGARTAGTRLAGGEWRGGRDSTAPPTATRTPPRRPPLQTCLCLGRVQTPVGGARRSGWCVGTPYICRCAKVRTGGADSGAFAGGWRGRSQ